MRLSTLLERAAAAALRSQRPDGSFAPGHNGPYRDPETPARNTGHWLVTLAALWRRGGEPAHREAALRAAAWLAGEKARPGGAAFLHRTSPGKDACNGLVGQAFSIEALAEAAESLEAPELARVAEEVFLAHRFDEDAGLWHRLEPDGTQLSLDVTLNHQLWFAAAGALLAPHADPEVGERVMCFLDCLDANLAVDASGLVRQPIAPWRVLHGDLRLGARLWLVARRDRERAKERGYLGFNLYALALLRRHTPEDRVWQLTRVTRALALARSPHFREALADNPFGWGYNPSGIEIPFALEIFAGPASRGEQCEWLTEQLRRHWDPELCALSRATSDPATLAARIYEATRLADLQIPDAVASAARRNSEGPA